MSTGAHPPLSASSRPPSEVELLVRQANDLWGRGARARAEQLCRQALARSPSHPHALHLLGLIAHSAGHLDAAIAHLRQAVAAPRVPPVYFSNLAEMCRQRGLHEEGERAARRAVALDKKLAGGWNNLGIILQEMGRLEESRRCLARTLALEPADAEAHNNLANTLKRMGLRDEAQRHWSTALKLRPNYAEVFSNLSIVAAEEFDHERAVRLARRALALNPRLADAYVNIASGENGRGRHAEALRALEPLAGIAPDYPPGLIARANTLKLLDRPDEALATAQRAVELVPHNPDALNTLGAVLQALGRAEEALESYERAAAQGGLSREKSLVNRAVLLMEQGRTQEARAAFDAAQGEFPRSALVRFNRADLSASKPGGEDVPEMEELLASDPPPSRTDRMLLHFALGKAYLDRGQSDEAFAHLDAGNRTKRAGVGYDGPETIRWMKGIAETFDAELLARLADGDDPSPMPVFVLGMPRSGTTLIEQILASHPQIHGAGELKFLQQVVDTIPDYPRGAAGLDPQGLGALGATYLARIAPLAAGRPLVVDKMPANFMHIGLIRLILPNARIIHCRRDPVDTCLSCYSKLFATGQGFTYDLAELGEFHRAYQRLMAHWRVVIPPEAMIEVDYEAVVADTEAEARRLIDFLGLEWDEACLQFHRTRRTVRTASVNQVRRPIYNSSVGRWRAHARHLAPLLGALGISAEMAGEG